MSDSEEVTSAASYFNSAPTTVPPPANQQHYPPPQHPQTQEYFGISNEPPFTQPVIVDPVTDAAHNLAAMSMEDNINQEIERAANAEVEMQGRLQPPPIGENHEQLHAATNPYNDLHSSVPQSYIAQVPAPATVPLAVPVHAPFRPEPEGYFQPNVSEALPNQVSLRSGESQPFNFQKSEPEVPHYSVLASSNEGHPRNLNLNHQVVDDQGRARVRAPIVSSGSVEHRPPVDSQDVRASVRPHTERTSRPPLDEQRPGNRDPNSRAPIVPHSSDPTPLNRLPTHIQQPQLPSQAHPPVSQPAQAQVQDQVIQAPPPQFVQPPQVLHQTGHQQEQMEIHNRFSQSNQSLNSVGRENQQYQAPPPAMNPAYSQPQSVHPHQQQQHQQLPPHNPHDPHHQQPYQYHQPPPNMGYPPRPQYFPQYHSPQNHQYPDQSGRMTPSYQPQPPAASQPERPLSRPGSAMSARGSEYGGIQGHAYPPPPLHYGHHMAPPGPYGYPTYGHPSHGGFGHPPYGGAPYGYGAPYDPYGDPYRRPPYSRLPAWDRFRPSSEFDPGDDNESVASFRSQQSATSRRKKKNVYEELYKSMTINYDDDGWEDNYYVGESTRDEGRKTPPKFTQPHCIVRFSPTGKLVKVNAARVEEGESATFELHSVEALTANEPVNAPGLHSFPGPLTRVNTPKIDVVRYCAAKASDVRGNLNIPDRQSFALLWDLLALLVRSNDNAEGHDFSELLLGELTPEKSPEELPTEELELKSDRSIISEPSSRKSLRNLTTGRGYSETEKVNRFRELIQYGRQRDALDWAMKTGIWGHALMLSYKLDSSQHQKVMIRFMNSMEGSDPLQTAYTFLSGRQPTSVSQIEEGDLNSWRQHLAMILSNSTQNQTLTRNVYQRSITNLGDTLWNRGLLYASQFCYLLANGAKSFGFYNRKSSKIVLLGGDHTSEFSTFTSLSSIQMTEVYEYAVSLSTSKKSVLQSFQPVKYLYATWLVDYGLITQAFAYLEQIATVVLQEPSQYHSTLVTRLTHLALRLQLHDQQRQCYLEKAVAPEWLEKLLNLSATVETNTFVPPIDLRTVEDVVQPQSEKLTSMYEPKIDQSGRVSFSPTPTDSAPPSERIPSRLSSTTSDHYIPDPAPVSQYPDLAPPSAPPSHHQRFQTFDNEVPLRTRSRRNTERSEASLGDRRGSQGFPGSDWNSNPVKTVVPNSLNFQPAPVSPSMPGPPAMTTPTGPAPFVYRSGDPSGNTSPLPVTASQAPSPPAASAVYSGEDAISAPPIFMPFNPQVSTGPQYPTTSQPTYEPKPMAPLVAKSAPFFQPPMQQTQEPMAPLVAQPVPFFQPPMQQVQQSMSQHPTYEAKPMAPLVAESAPFVPQTMQPAQQPIVSNTQNNFAPPPNTSTPWESPRVFQPQPTSTRTSPVPPSPVDHQAPSHISQPHMPQHLPHHIYPCNPPMIPQMPTIPQAPVMPEDPKTPPQPALPSIQPAPSQQNQPPPTQPPPKSQENPQKSTSNNSRSFLGSLVRKVLPNSLTGEAYLPDDTDKSLVWDEDKKRWVDLSSDGTGEEAAPPPPPPTLGGMGQLGGSASPMGQSQQLGMNGMANGLASPSLGPASFRRGNKKGRNMYKDAKALGETLSVSNKMIPDGVPGVPSGAPGGGAFFMPQPTTGNGQAAPENQPTQQQPASMPGNQTAPLPATHLGTTSNQAPPPGPMFFNPSQFGGPTIMPQMPTQGST